MLNVRYDYANGKTMNGTAEDLSGVREAMFALQQHTETSDIWARDRDSDETIARLQFEWIEDGRTFAADADAEYVAHRDGLAEGGR